MEIKKCEVLTVFCVERPSEEGAPLGGGIELCGSSSCLGALRSLFMLKDSDFANVSVE